MRRVLYISPDGDAWVFADADGVNDPALFVRSDRFGSSLPVRSTVQARNRLQVRNVVSEHSPGPPVFGFVGMSHPAAEYIGYTFVHLPVSILSPP